MAVELGKVSATRDILTLVNRLGQLALEVLGQGLKGGLESGLLLLGLLVVICGTRSGF